MPKRDTDNSVSLFLLFRRKQEMVVVAHFLGAVFLFFEMDKHDKKAVITKLSSLYVTSRKKFLVLTNSGHYITCTYDPANRLQPETADFNSANEFGGRSKYPLTNSRVRAHLMGRKTLGVFGLDRASTFLSIDVDIDDRWIVQSLINEILCLGFQQANILASSSGGKGFHIDLFFDAPTSGAYLHDFYRLILARAGLTEMCDKIEFRPTATQGVKLPLGVNFASSKKENFCSLLDSGLYPIDDPLRILGVEKAPSGLLISIVNEWLTEIPSLAEMEKATRGPSKRDESVTASSSPTASIALRPPLKAPPPAQGPARELYQNGLIQTGTRHSAIVRIAVLLRCDGYSENETRVLLHAWMNTQDPATFTTPLPDCHLEIDRVVGDVYRRCYGVVRHGSMHMSKSELTYIVKNAATYNAMLCLTALFMHARKLHCHGVVAMSYDQVAAYTGLCNKTPYNLMTHLLQNGVLRESEIRLLPGVWGKRNIKHYNLPSFEVAQEEYVLFEKHNTAEEVLCKAIDQLLTPMEKRQLLKRSVQERLKKAR